MCQRPAAPPAALRRRARPRLVGAGRPRRAGAAGVGRVPRDRRRARPGRPDPARRLDRPGTSASTSAPGRAAGRCTGCATRPSATMPPPTGPTTGGDLRPGRAQRGRPRGPRAARRGPTCWPRCRTSRDEVAAFLGSATRPTSSVRGGCARCSARCRWAPWSRAGGLRAGGARPRPGAGRSAGRRRRPCCRPGSPPSSTPPARWPPAATISAGAGCVSPGGRLGLRQRCPDCLDHAGAARACRRPGRSSRAAPPTCSTPRPDGGRCPPMLARRDLRLHHVTGLLALAPIVEAVPGLPGGSALRAARAQRARAQPAGPPAARRTGLRRLSDRSGG